MVEVDFKEIKRRYREIQLDKTGVLTANGSALDEVGQGFDCLRGGCDSDEYYRTKIIDKIEKMWYGKPD